MFQEKALCYRTMKYWIKEQQENITLIQQTGQVLCTVIYRAQQAGSIIIMLQQNKNTVIDILEKTTSHNQALALLINKPFRNQVHMGFENHLSSNLSFQRKGNLELLIDEFSSQNGLSMFGQK